MLGNIVSVERVQNNQVELLFLQCGTFGKYSGILLDDFVVRCFRKVKKALSHADYRWIYFYGLYFGFREYFCECDRQSATA